jgi:PAS domain S-box-containing protein
MKSHFHILHLEDDSRDADLVQETLAADGITCQMTRIETEADFIASLQKGRFDLIFADYTLPSFDGLSALKIAQRDWPHVPFIFVSGTLDEEVAIEALKNGATDYVFKTRLSRIVPSVQRALREADERTGLAHAEEALRRSEAYLAEAQKLSHTGSFGWDVSTGEIYWSRETFRIFGYEPAPKATIELVVQRTHPEDRSAVQQLIDRVCREREAFDFDHRLLMPDGLVKYVRVVGHPSRDASGRFEFVGAVTDITERKRGELLLRESEQRFRAIFNEAGSGIAVNDLVSGGPIENNRALQTLLGCSRDELGRLETYDELTCEEDREADAILFRELCNGNRETLRQEKHMILRDGRSVWANVIFTLLRDSEGRPSYVIAIHEDVTERKQSEEKLKRSEASLAEAQKLTHSGSWSWNVRTHDAFWSQEMFRILSYDPDKIKPALSHFLERVHPEDRPVVEQLVKHEASGSDLHVVSDYRIVLPDRTIKHLHAIAHPVTNPSGEVIEVVGTSMDVTEQVEARNKLENALDEIKKLRDQLFKENLALREEIDKASMFEEIVGDSPALHDVLARVAKVAPTDSTILITGETGTGKELFARAIHKRSRRASRAFVSVNCAATPATLIASELFGHEKGAFTGAVQRRLGRFELAEGGTIFLDEIGELPAETQIALLRVLQEREFERVGGSQSIRADVRVIAATNRDLIRAIAVGAFRKDLFYRLNVFPIEIPPLRERREDIPTLIEYFVHRYSRKVGKKIRTIEKKTLELLKSYAWPGNIRELQNVIERSVIVCETDLLSVDPSWLSFESSPPPQGGRPIARMSPAQERQAIETVLAATEGRVSGPLGAAANLGMPASTLESKIRSLKINKFRFKKI